jgi:DNA-directed RNA polymerase subunit RPC12/RpoP
MQNYNCKTCGAELHWDTHAGCLKCKFCESEFQPEDFADNTVAQQVQSEEVNPEFTTTAVESEDMSIYECKNCGGEVVTLKTTMATVCPYCGEAISITSKSVGAFRPELCIPFKQDKKEITKLYKSYVSRSFLTPKSFKEEHTVEKIQGLFVPFYLHTMTDKAQHQFSGEKTSSHKRGYDKVTKHDVYDLQINAVGTFEKIPTDGSVRIDNKLMDAVEPFDYQQCKPYNPAYMAGFMAEQIDDDIATMNDRAETRAKEGMRSKARDAFSDYSSLVVKNEHQTINDHKSQYVMMPLWMLNVKHNNKKYTYAINGQTGKVVGKLPMDKIKLFFIGLGVFLASDLIIALISMFA